MVSLGMLVLVVWPGMTEHGCIGMLSKLEYIEEVKETITVLKNVKCPDGSQYTYIVGINKDKLKPQ